MGDTRPCSACGAPLGRRARFCGRCGAKSESDEFDPSEPGRHPAKRETSGRASIRRRREARVESRRTSLGVAFLYVGALLVVLFMPWPEGEQASRTVVAELLFACAIALVGVLGVAILGRDAHVAAMGGRATLPQVGVGALVGTAVLAVNVALIYGLQAMFTNEATLGLAHPESWLLGLFGMALLPALVEEWLCRGALWAGLQRITGERGTLLLSSLLFAMLHGLNGAGILELPTRFVAGLAFGALRSRTGSLLPGIAAHFVNNALSLGLA